MLVEEFKSSQNIYCDLVYIKNIEMFDEQVNHIQYIKITPDMVNIPSDFRSIDYIKPYLLNEMGLRWISQETGINKDDLANSSWTGVKESSYMLAILDESMRVMISNSIKDAIKQLNIELKNLS